MHHDGSSGSQIPPEYNDCWFFNNSEALSENGISEYFQYLYCPCTQLYIFLAWLIFQYVCGYLDVIFFESIGRYSCLHNVSNYSENDRDGDR